MKSKVSHKENRLKVENGGLVSIVMPVYNVKHYLVESIESVIHQSYTNLEIIIIDDGSTDGSSEICDKYDRKDNRIHVIHQNNKGLSNARNKGLALTTGEFVAFLDSDDAFYPAYIETMMDVLLRNNADIASCSYTVHYTNRNMKFMRNTSLKPQMALVVYNRIEALHALADGIIDHHVWNKLYKRELWKNVKFPEGQLFEDKNTTYRIFDRCTTVCVLDTFLYAYRRRPESITSIVTEQSVQDWLLAQYQFETFVEINIPAIFSHMQLIEIRKSLLDEMIGYYIRISWRKGDKAKETCKVLRERIMNISHKTNNLKFRTKVGCKMICYCPRFLRCVYPVYLPFRQVYKRFFCHIVNRKDV